jgi:catechol 2,3-dioxygenase-like lactoylglutathione lyase family enzyme
MTARVHIDERQSMGATVSRVQLALNVSNLDEAIVFYSKLFQAEPAKVRAGYANFAITEPPLKLVLIENVEEAGSLNHLGVEVFSTTDVVDATTYFGEAGLTTHVEDETTCCYAVQDKVWVDGVDGLPWEIYTVLSDSTTADGVAGDDRCCSSVSTTSPDGLTVANCC